MKLAASLDVNGNKIKDGNKVYSMPSVAGTLAVLSDIPKGSFVIMGTATAISQDNTTLTVDGEPLIASQSNLGHVYQIGEDEFVSNGEEWIVLGAEVDLSEYQQKTDQLLTTVDKTIVGAINEINNKVIKANLISMNFYDNIEWAQWYTVMGSIRINYVQTLNINKAYITIGNNTKQDFLNIMTTTGYIDIPANTSVIFDVEKIVDGNSAISITYNIINV